MKPSSTLCRTQEARQHALAAGTNLANVKAIAMMAAAAWAKEALIADKREQRLTLSRPVAAPSAGTGIEPPRPYDHSFSENPDRGFADAAPVPRY